MPAPTPLERDLRVVAGDGGAGAPQAPPAPRAHVCFVAPTTWPIFSGQRDIQVVGGAELQQSVIARALVARGYRVSMICLNYGQHDGTVLDGVTIRNMHRPDEGIPVARFLHPRLTSLWRAMKQVGADIYYQRTSACLTGFVAAFCRRHGKRSIYAGASDVDFIPGRQDIAFARDRWLFEYGLRNVDSVVVQNPSQLDNLRRHYGREASVIPNCFTPPPGARADRGGSILWVATVRPQKRPELLLELARRLPQHRFVMIGGSDPGWRAEEYARAIGAQAAKLPNVEFRGFVPFEEADRQFGRARLVLNTSLYEGFPNTFLQAWSRGVPTLAFVDTGSRHQGEPVYDLLADPADAALRIERMMRDDVAWQHASQRVLAHFRERHSVEAVAGLYEGEFARLLGGR
ncbi:MAG TPA: glycosyltransferase family 4 protein [Myxococcota bacterium]|nr:glycosyltransferase family 4 protein [Myxococcota bacterium]